jgi:hypothetical protein
VGLKLGSAMLRLRTSAQNEEGDKNMDFQKLTNRSRAAIAEAEAVARAHNHQEVDSLHLTKALL